MYCCATPTRLLTIQYSTKPAGAEMKNATVRINRHEVLNLLLYRISR